MGAYLILKIKMGMIEIELAEFEDKLVHAELYERAFVPNMGRKLGEIQRVYKSILLETFQCSLSADILNKELCFLVSFVVTLSSALLKDLSRISNIN